MCCRFLRLAAVMAASGVIYGVGIPLLLIWWEFHTKCPYCAG
jgi:hypothetical protein